MHQHPIYVLSVVNSLGNFQAAQLPAAKTDGSGDSLNVDAFAAIHLPERFKQRFWSRERGVIRGSGVFLLFFFQMHEISKWNKKTKRNNDLVVWMILGAEILALSKKMRNSGMKNIRIRTEIQLAFLRLSRMEVIRLRLARLFMWKDDS